MLLVIDIGNSNNVLGLFSGERLLTHWRIRTEANRTVDEYWILIKEFILINKVKAENIDEIIIACVVPNLAPVLMEMGEKYFSCKPLMVGPGIKTGISIRYNNPSEVGADRIANAVAGFSKYKGPLIIVDFGTATTFDAVSAKGVYLGGAIFPGVQISMEALFKNTAKLPRVDLATPIRVIGKSTVESIQSGAIHGVTGMVLYIVERMQNELDEKAKVIATGGVSNSIVKSIGIFDDVDQLLTLNGLLQLNKLNRTEN